MISNKTNTILTSSYYPRSYGIPADFTTKFGGWQRLESFDCFGQTLRPTKMIIVPIHALIKTPDSLENLDYLYEQHLLSKISAKLHEGGRYVLVADYRPDAVFTVIDLDSGNSQKSDELHPYSLPFYDEPFKILAEPKEYERRRFGIYCSELK